MFSRMLDRMQQRRERDKKRWAEHDENTCMLCGAQGQDKRSLFIDCFYQIQEVVPEAIDLFLVPDLKDRGYYLRICKNCRGELLGYLRRWREERIALRGVPKDHDGYPLEGDRPEANIPVRVDGRTVMMTEDEWRLHRAYNIRQEVQRAQNDD